MKKFFNANFMLEVIIDEDGLSAYILRDVNGHVCVNGSMNDVVSFMTYSYNHFMDSQKKGD